MARFSQVVSVSLLAQALLGCSSSTAADAPAPADPEDAGAVPPDVRVLPDVVVPDGEAVPDDLAALAVGTYALRLEAATIQKIPIFGDTNALATTLALAEIRRHGDGLELEEKLCRIRIDTSVDAGASSVPDALPLSVPAFVHPLKVWREGAAIRFSRRDIAIGIGAKLDDPFADALPTDPADERVWDQDDDGNPGVTVLLSGALPGTVYVAQRMRNEYVGTVTAARVFRGYLTDRSEQSILDAVPTLLKVNVPVTPDPDLEKSLVRLAPIAAGADCSKLAADEQALFP